MLRQSARKNAACLLPLTQPRISTQQCISILRAGNVAVQTQGRTPTNNQIRPYGSKSAPLLVKFSTVFGPDVTRTKVWNPILAATARQEDAEAKQKDVEVIQTKLIRAYARALDALNRDVDAYNRAYRALKNRIRLSNTTVDEDVAADAKVAAAKEDVAAAEDKVAAAKKDVAAAKEDVAVAEAKVAAAKEDVAAAKEDVAAAKSKSEAIISDFRELTPIEHCLTCAPPYGILGRDWELDSILDEMSKPSDKFPPITVISTSRAGKTLLLDSLVAKCNENAKIGSSTATTAPVFVVTCSLNGTRVSGSDFRPGECTPADIPLFVAFVMNALLFGSIGHHKKPTDATADSLAWPTVLSPASLCTLIREKYGLDPKVKLLLAIDELTTFFDRFDPESRKEIASALGLLCNRDSRLLLTGFTNKATNAYLGVSGRRPVEIVLPSITPSNRYKLIPLMTAMLWVVRCKLSAHPFVNDSILHFQYVYCIMHESLKSSPGLMGTVVENLVQKNWELNVPFSSDMWGVVEAVMRLLPDSNFFKNPELRGGAFKALDAYLLARANDDALSELMSVNMASPDRLDAFRVIMAMIVERKARNIGTSNDMSWPENDTHAPPPSVKVLFRFMDAYRAEYTKWKIKSCEFRMVKGIFFEVACRYGVELLWHRVSNGADDNLGWRDDTKIHRTEDGGGFALKCEGFLTHFPVSAKGNTMEVAKSMFEPDTLLYPITAALENSKSRKTAVENNPLLDLVLNLRASNKNKKGVVQVWIQAKHTESMKPLQKKTLKAAMEVVKNYNTTANAEGRLPVLEVVFLVVGPSRLCLKINDGKENNKEITIAAINGKGDSRYWSCSEFTVPLTVSLMTMEKERERLLGPFISQIVPDFDSHDSELENKLWNKCDTMSALCRTTPSFGSCEEADKRCRTHQTIKDQEEKFFQSLKTTSLSTAYQTWLSQKKELGVDVPE